MLGWAKRGEELVKSLRCNCRLSQPLRQNRKLRREGGRRPVVRTLALMETGKNNLLLAPPPFSFCESGRSPDWLIN